VGFIRDLPHKLVEAFEATLQEAADADLLLHVVDCASPLLDEQMAEVERVLGEIGAAAIPQVLVFNKLDRLEASQRPRVLRDLIEREGGQRVPRVFVSALDGTGIAELREVLTQAVAGTLASHLNGEQAAPGADLVEAAPDDSMHAPGAVPSTGTHDSYPSP
jgi:GTPase